MRAGGVRSGNSIYKAVPGWLHRELRELRGSEAGDLLFWNPGKPSQDGDIPICQIPACQKVVGVPDPKGVIISTRRRQIKTRDIGRGSQPAIVTIPILRIQFYHTGLQSMLHDSLLPFKVSYSSHRSANIFLMALKYLGLTWSSSSCFVNHLKSLKPNRFPFRFA
jgi:hypothetical protein